MDVQHKFLDVIVSVFTHAEAAELQIGNLDDVSEALQTIFQSMQRVISCREGSGLQQGVLQHIRNPLLALYSQD